MKNKTLLKLFTNQVVPAVIDESMIGCKEIICRFSGNYMKRRNVGFGVISSVSGSFYETKNYYTDILSGKYPHEYIPAIEFEHN